MLRPTRCSEKWNKRLKTNVLTATAIEHLFEYSGSCFPKRIRVGAEIGSGTSLYVTSEFGDKIR